MIKVSNKFRSDGLNQKVALKEIDGELEEEASREGSAQLFYTFKSDKPEKPKALKKNPSDAEKKAHQVLKEDYDLKVQAYKIENNRRLEALIDHAQSEMGSHVLLKLPNKSVAKDADFGNLYNLFDDRFRDSREEIKKHLDRLQFGQLFEIIELFKASSDDKRALNRLITKLKKQGFLLQTRNDKKSLHSKLVELLNSDKSAYDVMQDAIQAIIISVSESHKSYLHRKDSESDRISSEPYLETFKAMLKEGHNTELRMLKYVSENDVQDISSEIIKEQFDERIRDIKIERFYNGLFGSDLKFNEILAFYSYEDDDSNFMTMHKTKGTGIENVIVVLDEFNWTKYDFASCFQEENANPSRQALSRKLLYVACSRTKKNLICVRLANDTDEVDRMKQYFQVCNEIVV